LALQILEKGELETSNGLMIQKKAPSSPETADPAVSGEEGRGDENLQPSSPQNCNLAKTQTAFSLVGWLNDKICL
jgi:hypothetical protein